MFRFSTFFLFLLITTFSFAQAPSGYYSTAVGKNKAELKTALYNIIKGHTDKGYDGLYAIYETSDNLSGKVWDMYSKCEWYHGLKKCGNYSSVCDCYNREHSIPQSWFNSNAPMVSDAFHVYPTDGKVNGQRSNYPFGECANGSTLTNGKGRLGSSSFSGYSGIVFEPDDEYKGDFARTYFYFATRYENIMTTINGESFNKTTFPSLSTWSLNLFLKWHRQDPVSKKELDRNNAIYSNQRNRNPFIDFPELTEYIWGNKQNENFTTSLNEVYYAPTIYYNNQALIIEDVVVDGVLSIYDLQGKLISKAEIFSGDNRIEVKLKSTIIAVINSNKGIYSKKIFIQN